MKSHFGRRAADVAMDVCDDPSRRLAIRLDAGMDISGRRLVALGLDHRLDPDVARALGDDLPVARTATEWSRTTPLQTASPGALASRTWT